MIISDMIKSEFYFFPQFFFRCSVKNRKPKFGFF